MSTFHLDLPSLTLPDDAVWLVTGTSSGIGLALLTSILSAQPSYRVVALSRDPSTIALPAASTPENTLLQPVDLTSETSIASAFDAAVAKFGRIDVVINNAGYGLFGEFESLSTAEGRELFEVNFWAPVAITKHALRVMREVNPGTGPIGGVIVQVSSIGGYITAPGNSFYHASKWALEGLTEGVAKELDPEWKIRFVIFEPGAVKTNWSKEGREKGVVQHEAYKRPDGQGLPSELVMKMRTSGIEAKISADSEKVAEVMTAVVRDVDGRWGGREMLRLPLGTDAWVLEDKDVKAVRSSLEKWKDTSDSTSSGDVRETLRAIGLFKD